MGGIRPRDLASTYLATHVEVEMDGRWVSAQDAARRMGAFHVVTAWNPGLERPGDEANDAANRRLHAELVAMGCAVRPAVGRDSAPGSEHAEPSWAVVGLSDAQALAIARRHGQWAVFRIRAGYQTVLWCDESEPCSRAVHC